MSIIIPPGTPERAAAIKCAGHAPRAELLELLTMLGIIEPPPGMTETPTRTTERKLLDPEQTEIALRLNHEGKSLADICHHLGASQLNVRATLNHHGLNARSKPVPNIEEMRADWQSGTMTIWGMSLKYRTSHQRVARLAREGALGQQPSRPVLRTVIRRDPRSRDARPLDPPDAQEAIRMFGEGHTVDAIRKHLGVTNARVSAALTAHDPNWRNPDPPNLADIRDAYQQGVSYTSIHRQFRISNDRLKRLEAKGKLGQRPNSERRAA